MILRKARDFKLKDQNGKYFTLSENKNKYTLLVFYPKDDSSVCTKQLCNYNENIDKFLNKNIQVIGISTDLQNSHSSFSKKYDFKFPLLSDLDGSISKEYGFKGVFSSIKRKLVLIDKDMLIVYEDTVLSIFYKKAAAILNLKILKNI